MSYQRRSSRPSSAASHSSRMSSSGYNDHELKLECKAVFLGRYDDTRDEIETKDDLALLLQQTGRNASNKVISKYWNRNTESVTFDEFVDICRKEPVTSEDDLMRAFRKIDLNGDGYISLDELFKIMTTKGEKMSRSEVKEMIDEVDENKDGRLDYREFSRMVVSSTQDFKKMSIKMMEKKDKKKQRPRDGDVSPRRDKDELSLGSQLSLRSSASEKRSRKRTPSSSSGKHNSNGHSAEGSRRKSHHSSHSKRQNGEDFTEWEDQNQPERRGSRLSVKSSRMNESMFDRRTSRPFLAPNESSMERRESRHSVHSHAVDESNLERRGSRQSIRSHVTDAGMPERRDSKFSVQDDGTDAPTPAERRASKVSVKTDIVDEPNMGRRESRLSIRSRATDADVTERRASKFSVRLNDSADEPGMGRRGSRQSVRSHADAGISERRASRASVRDDLMDAPGLPLSRSGSRQSLLSNATYDEVSRPSPRERRESRPKSASKGGRLSEPSNLREWSGVNSKGTFFLEEDKGIISHVYSLTLSEDTEVYLTIQPLRIGESGESLDGTIIDTALFILDSHDNSFVAFTDNKDSKGKYSLRCTLSMGTYQLIPFTTGCRLKSRQDVPTKEAKLISQKDGKIVLSRAFKKGLEEIFEMADLDGNGLLSRDEFNWFNLRTSGDEVGDEEWQVVEDNVELERGELTRTGFIKLNEMEADDNEGDTDDLWVTMTSMGFNKSLILDEACPFLMKVYTQDCNDPELQVVGLGSSKENIDSAVCEMVIARGEATKIKGMKDVTLYEYMNDHRAIFVVDNKSRLKLKIQLDCSRRRGLVSHTGSLITTLTVPPLASVVGHHILPLEDRGEFSVQCEPTVLK